MSAVDVTGPSRRAVTRRMPYSAPLAGATRVSVPILPALFLISVIALPLKLDVGGLVLSSTRVLAMVVVIPLLVWLLSGRAGRLRFVDFGIFIYAFWTIVTILYWHGSSAIPFVGSTTLELLSGYLIGRVCIRNVAQLAALVRFFTLVMLLTLPWAAFESITGRYLAIELFSKIPVFYGPLEWASPPRLGLHRAQVLIENAIHYGVICSMAFSLAMVGMIGQWSPARRLWTMFALFLCAFFSLSSGAFMAVLMQLGLIVWAAMFRARENRRIILISLAFIAYSIVEVLSDRDAITVLLSYATLSPASAFYRQRIFEFGMDNVWANPVMGIGQNDWVRPVWMVVSSVDNFWLLTAMRYGIPGFGFLAMAWISLIVAVMRRKPAPDTPFFWMRRAWLFTILSLTLSLCTVHVWGSVYALVLFLFATGVALLDDDDPGSQTGVDTVIKKRASHTGPRDRILQRKSPDRAPGRYTRYPGGSIPPTKSRK